MCPGALRGLRHCCSSLAQPTCAGRVHGLQMFVRLANSAFMGSCSVLPSLGREAIASGCRLTCSMVHVGTSKRQSALARRNQTIIDIRKFAQGTADQVSVHADAVALDRIAFAARTAQHEPPEIASQHTATDAGVGGEPGRAASVWRQSYPCSCRGHEKLLCRHLDGSGLVPAKSMATRPPNRPLSTANSAAKPKARPTVTTFSCALLIPRT